MDPFAHLNLPVAPPVRIQQDKDQWLKHMAEYYDKCTNNLDGLSREDLEFVALSVTSSRNRVPKSHDRHDIEFFEHDEERQQIIRLLLTRLEELEKTKLVSRDNVELVCSALSWSLLQVADMSQLRELERSLSGEDIPDFFQNVEKTIVNWQIQFKIFFTMPISQELSDRDANRKEVQHFTRSDAAAAACLIRDDGRCVITGDQRPQVTHIYPFSAVNSVHREGLGCALAQIWGQERAQNITGRLFNDGTAGIDCLGNTLSLSASLQVAWRRGDFALLPRRPRQDPLTQTWSIDLILYWMTPRPGPSTTFVGRTILTSAKAMLSQYLFGWERQLMAVNLDRNTAIVNGEVFTVSAKRMEDLPDYDVLMLQWDIIRMASLCGGAEPEDEEKEQRNIRMAMGYYSDGVLVRESELC